MLETIENITDDNWSQDFSADLKARAIAALESGKVLYLPKLSFKLNSNEKQFLSPTYADPKTKNISYDARSQQIKGVKASNKEQQELAEMMRRFSSQANTVIHTLFPRYISDLQQGRTSFRPLEISHRKISYRKDDTRLHVDAFPSSPNQGRRILRVFSNINPNRHDRVWRLGEPFEEVAKRFLPKISRAFPGSSFILKALGITKSKRTAYDHIMLQLHDSMKANMRYQKTVSQMEVRFPPACSWIVMTDHVSHAAMSGQHALEQTFYLPVEAMSDQQKSPLRVLEKLLSRSNLNL